MLGDQMLFSAAASPMRRLAVLICITAETPAPIPFMSRASLGLGEKDSIKPAIDRGIVQHRTVA